MEEEPEIQFKFFTNNQNFIFRAKSFYFIKAIEICDFAVLNKFTYEKINKDVLFLYLENFYRKNTFVFEGEQENYFKAAIYCDYSPAADFLDDKGNLLILNDDKKFIFPTGLNEIEIKITDSSNNKYNFKEDNLIFFIIKLYK